MNTAGSGFNTILAVYTGPGTDFASLVPQGCGFVTNFQTQGQPGVVVPGVAAGTRYYIMVDGYHGASGQARLQIGLGRPPALVSGPASQFATAGSNATFSVGAAGSTNLYYQWQLNGVALAQATNASYTVTNAQTNAVGSYTVVVSNMVGVVTSAPPAVLSLQFAPGITAEPTNVTVALGKKAVLAVAAVGVNTKTNPFHYQWYQGVAPVRGATNAGLVLAGGAMDQPRELHRGGEQQLWHDDERATGGADGAGHRGAGGRDHDALRQQFRDPDQPGAGRRNGFGQGSGRGAGAGGSQ